MKYNSLWILITFPIPFQKNRKEIKLCLITLQNPVGVRAVMTTLEAKHAHCPGLAPGYEALPMGLTSASLAEQFVSIRRELKEHKCTYLFSLWTKQKYLLFMWNKWKITSPETWVQSVSSSQQCYQFQYIKFLKHYSMKPSLYEWNKVYQWSISVVLNHFGLYTRLLVSQDTKKIDF